MLSIIYTNDNIFESEPYSVIAHACNCKGSWGAGIARQMRENYPIHYQEYKDFCSNNSEDGILGGSLLIGCNVNNTEIPKNHWIACLFTDLTYGSKNPTEAKINSILNATKQSIMNLLCQINDAKEENSIIKDIHIPKINSGYFGVPWNRTEQVLKDINTKSSCTIYIHTI